MPRYLVEVKQILEGTVVVEAEDEEDALEVVEYWIKEQDDPMTEDDLNVSSQSFWVECVICECD